MTHPSPGLLVVSRFRVAASERTAFLAAAAAAMDALAAQPGCRSISLGQSTDDAELLSLTGDWDGVGAYRRGLSSFDVKVRAVPLLSTAIDEPSAYEVVRQRGPDGTITAVSGLAADAGDVGLGHASAPHVPGVPS